MMYVGSQEVYQINESKMFKKFTIKFKKQNLFLNRNILTFGIY